MTAASDTKFWDGIADKYAARPLPNPDSTAKKLDIVRSLVDAESTLVDIGCGTGTIALELAPGVGAVRGIDMSGEMVRIARGKATDAGAGNVAFEQAGVLEGLRALDDASVDCLCAFNILHLVAEWRSVLGEAFRVVRPGGSFVSSTVCLNDTWIPFRPLIAVMRWFGKAPHVVFLRAQEVLEGMTAAGFADLQRPEVGADKNTAFVVARRPA